MIVSIDDKLKDLREHEIIAISCFKSDEKYCNHILCEGLDSKGYRIKYYAIQFDYKTKSGIIVPYQVCFFKAQYLLKSEVKRR